MIELVDGPAKASVLMLARAPSFLRAVVGPGGKIDALDQVIDSPEPDEAIHVYERVEYRGPVSIRLARPTRCIWTHSATYRHRPDVDGEQFREFPAWRDWCLAQPPRAEGVDL